MRVSEAENVQVGVVGSMHNGVLAQKILWMGENGSPNNYSIIVGRTRGRGWQAPRRRHNFDQIRLVLKGICLYGKGTALEVGTIAYYPEGVLYGPQERQAKPEMTVCQFGGASVQGDISVYQHEAANAPLGDRGDWKDGILTWHDEKGQEHDKDGFEATYEEVMWRKPEYPKPRYEGAIIQMRPESSRRLPNAAPGVATK